MNRGLRTGILMAVNHGKDPDSDVRGNEKGTMRAGSKTASRIWRTVAVLVLLSPCAVHAEPGASMSHIPVLRMIVIAGAVLAAMVPLVIWRLLKPRPRAWPFWVAAAVLALLVLVIIGPVFIALASILITGRTM